MSATASIAVLLLIAFAAANLPFFTERILFVVKSRRGKKSLAWRLLEVLLLYFLIGVLALLLENRSYGGIYPQNWEFYAITFCLFIVFAYPGFVYRYLWRGKRL